MGLFNKNNLKDTADLITPADYDEVGNFSSSTAYLQGLSDDEYAKVLKVSEIRRQADKDCAIALDETLEPSTFIYPKEVEPAPPSEPNFLDDLEMDMKPKKVDGKVAVL